MEHQFETLSEAMLDLQARGYIHDFNLQPHGIECKSIDLKLEPEAFHVDEIYRFEGQNDPDDSSVLFAITSKEGVKGLLVDAYGVYTEGLSPEMIARLKIDRDTIH